MLEVYSKVRDEVVGRGNEIKSILAAMEAGKHILLEGPPGTSKSTLLRTIAKFANIPFYIVEGNIDLTPAKLTGHFNPARVIADGFLPEYFEKGPLTRAMEEGGILYIEEFNRMPADVSNVLITPMEEGEIYIPRFGLIRAVRPFTVIASQNPYDDVGTVRVSRAFMDRISLIRMDYQSAEEEMGVVLKRAASPNTGIASAAVELVRKSRVHPDIKLGASVRAAIDIADLYISLQKIEDSPEHNFLSAAKMALSNKILPNEISARTPEEIVEEIWLAVKDKREQLINENDGVNGWEGKTTQAVGQAQSIREAADCEKKKTSVM